MKIKSKSRNATARGDATPCNMTVAQDRVLRKDSATMTHGTRMLQVVVLLLGGLGHAQAQIDPAQRELVQLGYNQPLEGRGPIAAYGFYFLNQPNWLQRSNLTLRLAVAPVYVDSEFGFSGLLGPHTDLGVGAAGGGYADSYAEVRQGEYHRNQSFLGHGGEVSGSIYHLFNPGSRIPLHGLVRGAAHYSFFADDSKTAEGFELPEDQGMFRVRAGLRYGGREPVMMPELAMELSAWYEGEFRSEAGHYGFNGDRELESDSHQFWARALLNYTLPKSRHSFAISLTAGTGANLDRFSAYRIGGNLPLYSEFPLTLPGYFFQELSATSFGLLSSSYNLPLDARQRWMINFTATTAWMDYLEGFAQPGRWHSGIGGGLIYRSPSDAWQLAVGYGYGINALRDGGRGAQSISILIQFDLDRSRQKFFNPGDDLNQSRGLQQFIRGVFR